MEIYLNGDLVSLKGLEKLNAVGDKLFVHDNKVLASLDGLNGFQKAFSGVLVYDNLQLTNIKALSSLSVVNPTRQYPFGVHVINCPELASLEGLSGLKDIAQLELRHLPKLTSLENTFPAGSGTLQIHNLTIAENARLLNMTGLRAFKSHATQPSVLLNITANAILASLDGLEGFTRATEIRIDRNPKLVSVKALASLKNWSEVTVAEFKQDWSLCDLTGIDASKAQADKCDPTKADAESDKLMKETGGAWSKFNSNLWIGVVVSLAISWLQI